MIFPRLKRISIHAPRMGSDRERRTARTGSTHFNPRSPDGERRSSACSSESSSPYFNPRSPDGERRVTLSRVIGVSNFNPRSPDVERRSRLIWVRSLPYSFQSTLPGWGATKRGRETRGVIEISIHAPRMGSDHGRFMGHAPLVGISIHAPRMGSDRFAPSAPPPTAYFNPRSPDGERPVIGVRPQHFDISIHAPRMGSDGYFIGCPKFIIRISIHAPRMGSDRHAHARMGARRSISIHAPRMGSDDTS